MSSAPFGKESYSVECGWCHEARKIDCEEVDEGQYKCPVCNYANLFPDSVRAEYRKNCAKDELRRQEKERQQREVDRKRGEHAERRAEREKEWEKKLAAAQQARQEGLAWMVRRGDEGKASRGVSLRAGQCPDCGGELQILQKGYAPTFSIARLHALPFQRYEITKAQTNDKGDDCPGDVRGAPLQHNAFVCAIAFARGT